MFSVLGGVEGNDDECVDVLTNLIWVVGGLLSCNEHQLLS
jgi:hypothetical protein